MIKITDHTQLEKVMQVREKVDKKYNMEICFKQLHAHNWDVQATIVTLERRAKSGLILPKGY